MKLTDYSTNEGNNKNIAWDNSAIGSKNNTVLQHTATTLNKTNANEAAEVLNSIPNIIICRKYAADRQNDMAAFAGTLPEALQKITYLHDSNEVFSHLKKDKKNLVFLGQYFDYGPNWTQIAHTIKNSNINAEVILITSISLSSSDLFYVDKYYKISQIQWQADGSEYIVSHVINSLPQWAVKIPKFKWLIGNKAKLEFALEILHSFMEVETAKAVFAEGRKGNVFEEKVLKELEDEFLPLLPFGMPWGDPENAEKFSTFRDKILSLAGVNN